MPHVFGLLPCNQPYVYGVGSKVCSASSKGGCPGTRLGA
jgi:hypothetical protein